VTVVYVWTVCAAAGVLVQSFLIYDSLQTFRQAREFKLSNGARRRIVLGHLRSGMCYWIIHSVFLYVGLRVIFEFDFGAVGWLFVGAAVLLVLAGLADHRDRVLLRR